jgi:acyl-CoA synthetase (NDP forming)
MTTPMQRLLHPQSIAIVGASERPEAIGTRLIRNLGLMGFQGTIYPVNPRYQELAGLVCYPSLAALPETPDAAFLAVPAANGPALMQEAADRGIKAVFTNANGYADGDTDGVALQREIEAIAAAHGIALCGPNNLGLINVHDRCAVWTPRYMDIVRPGPVAVISQSGSVALILSEDERKLGFSYLITAGNEAVLTVADYLDAVVRDDRVGVVLMFLETVRDPARFAAAAAEAQRRGKPIVTLKLGSSETGRALVQAHTGSLAGEDRLYDAFFKALGIIRVRTLDEMLETAVLLSASPAPPPTRHFVPVSLSGGESALLADLGGDLGIGFAPLSDATLARLRPAFPPYSKIGNPLDAWGLGFNAERFRIVLHALLDDPDIGVIAFSVDAPGQGGCDVPYACIMAEACAEARTDKRLVFFNNTSGTGVNADVRAILDRAGIAYLSGMRPAMAAIGHLLRFGVPSAPLDTVQPGAEPPPDEVGRFVMLTQAGVPMIATEAAATQIEAVGAAARLGIPVVLKGVADHLPHKTELGLVRLRLVQPGAIAAAFDEVATILHAHAQPGAAGAVVVQAMAGEGIELILGIRTLPGFGSFVLVGLGGVLVEVSNQVAVRLGPVDAATALEMLEETAAARLLRGVRGRGPYAIGAAAEAIAAFSRFGAAQAARYAAIEINPLIVGPEGAVGVDLLFEPNQGRPE